MKRLFSIALVLFLSACSNPPAEPKPEMKAAAPAAPPAPAADASAKWTVTEGIDIPESVYADQASGFIFSSQIVGMPDAKDGNGRIVKLDGDGKVIDANWVTGLNAPKGLRSAGGTLWTADIDEVIGIDIASGKITSRVKPEGAKFLNDVAAGPDGTVYVSDMALSRIYAVRNGKASVFADGEDLEYPNGILVEGDHLVVGGWGKPEPDFSTKVPGRLFSIDLKTKKKTLITAEPFGNIDGDGKGGYIVSDYPKGKISHVSSKGEAHDLKQFAPGTADIAFVSAQNLLIVPHTIDNKLVAYDLSDAVK